MNNMELPPFLFIVGALVLFSCGKPADTSFQTSSSEGGLSSPATEDSPPVAKEEGRAIRIVALGDSLTAGKDLGDPDADAYPAVLERELRAKGLDVNVENAGQSGDTTADILARLDYSVGEDADIVLLAVGANDTFQGKRIENVEKNLSAIVQRLKTKGASVLLFAMKTFPNLGPDYAGGFERLYARVAEKEKVVLVPFFLSGVSGVPAHLSPDGIHPNKEGYARTVENIFPYVERAVEETKRRPARTRAISNSGESR